MLLLLSFLRRIPLWYEAKLLLVAWLVLPQFRGASFIYDKFVREQLRKNGVRLHDHHGHGHGHAADHVPDVFQVCVCVSLLIASIAHAWTPANKLFSLAALVC